MSSIDLESFELKLTDPDIPFTEADLNEDTHGSASLERNA